MATETTLITPLRHLHERLGASLAEYFGMLLPDRYVEPAGECRTARESAALFDASYFAAFEFTGQDRVRYLNAVTTNDIRNLPEGQGNAGLLLNPQGHILAEVTTLALAEKLLLLSPAMVRERTRTTLDKYIIMDDVTLSDVTDERILIGVEGPRAEAVLEQLCGASLSQMTAGNHVDVNVAALPCRLIRASTFGESGALLLAERRHGDALWAALLSAVRAVRGGPIGFAAINALRLESRIPWFGYDFDDSVIPHEAGLQDSHISYTKGCYTGQEIVERVRSRGHANRLRVALQFLGRSVPPRGAKLQAQGKDAGHVTSATLAPHQGRVFGMGYLRREHANPGSIVEWEGGEAEVL